MIKPSWKLLLASNLATAVLLTLLTAAFVLAAVSPTVYLDDLPSDSFFTIKTDGSNIWAVKYNGDISYEGTTAHTVINNALGALTSGRSSREKVLLRGSFTISSAINLPSHTIFQLDGKITLASGTSGSINMLYIASGYHDMEITGGELDGNRDNCHSSDVNAIYGAGNNYDINIHHMELHNMNKPIGSGSAGQGVRFIAVSSGGCARVTISYMYIHHNGAYDGSFASANGNAIILTQAQDCSVDHNYIHDIGGGGIYIYVENTNKNCSNVIINHNKMYRVGRDGVSLYTNGVTTRIYRVIIDGNILVDAGLDAMHPNIGMGWSGATEGACTECVVSNNIFMDSSGRVNICQEAILIPPASHHNIITGNNFYNCSKRGIVCMGYENLIANNIFNGSQTSNRAAIYDYDSLLTDPEKGYRNTITGNVIRDWYGDGMRIYGNDNIISNNRVEYCSSYGIRIFSGATANMVHGNYIDNNGTDYLDEGTSTAEHDNFINGAWDA